MTVKLIFFKHPKSGEEDFKFCPFAKTGCENCFLPEGCRGIDSEQIAFRLELIEGNYQMIDIVPQVLLNSKHQRV